MMNCIFFYEYDEFLVCLNAAMLPTLNQGSMGDCIVYFPIFRNSSNVSWNASYPFEISSYVLDYDLVSGFIFIMKNTKHWKSLLVEVTDRDSTLIGRPSWLFDWHKDNKCGVWFTSGGNHTIDDVSVP
ncbi:hypothetical protein WN943_007453 [Citrus x changshan-huyou]